MSRVEIFFSLPPTPPPLDDIDPEMEQEIIATAIAAVTSAPIPFFNEPVSAVSKLQFNDFDIASQAASQPANQQLASNNCIFQC